MYANVLWPRNHVGGAGKWLLATAVLLGGFQVGLGRAATAVAQDGGFSPYGQFPFFPGGPMFGPGFSPGEASWDRSPDYGSSGSSSAAPARPATMTGGRKKGPIVTVALPDAFKPGDRDGDGQIGLYEWKTWKGRAALAEFRAFDRDSDGFVTPREIAAGPRATPTASAIGNAPTSASASTTGAGPTSNATATTGVPTGTQTGMQTVSAPSTAASTLSGSATAAPSATTGTAVPSPSGKTLPTGEAADAAKRYFPLLDADKDGKISPTEWLKSVRIRGMFQEAKIDISQPMAHDDFVINYVAASANKK